MAETKKSGIVDTSKVNGANPADGVDKLYIDNTWKVEDVLKYNAEGKELVFLHEKGKFLAMPDEAVRALDRDNKTRYHMARDLNIQHHPEADELHHRIQMSQQIRSRNLAEQELKRLPQSAQAARKLAAYVGEGYRQHWFRPDEIGTAIESGYEFVSPDMVQNGQAFTTVSSTDGHFEVKTTEGKTDLILMRVPEELGKKIDGRKAQAKDRQKQAIENSGKAILRNLGGNPDAASGERGDLNWEKVD